MIEPVVRSLLISRDEGVAPRLRFAQSIAYGGVLEDEMMQVIDKNGDNIIAIDRIGRFRPFLTTSRRPDGAWVYGIRMLAADLQRIELNFMASEVH